MADETRALREALARARAAAGGDSNDAEIEAWQEVGDLLDDTLAVLATAPTEVRVTTREVREGGNTFAIADLEDIAGTTLAAAGSLEDLFEAAAEADPRLYEELVKYDEIVESDRTFEFVREGEV